MWIDQIQLENTKKERKLQKAKVRCIYGFFGNSSPILPSSPWPRSNTLYSLVPRRAVVPMLSFTRGPGKYL
jgi:hypothetical protein